MKRIAAFALSALSAGCLMVPVPRNPLPLSAGKRPDGPLVVLPVRAAAVTVTEETDESQKKLGWKPESCAGDCNKVLDSLTYCRGNDFLGPARPSSPPERKRLESTVESVVEAARAGNPDAAERGAHVAREFNTACAVRMEASVTGSRRSGSGGIFCPFLVGSDWWGSVTVRTELWDIPSARCIGTATATHRFWGSFANPLIIGGWLVWKPFTTAVDEELRDTLAELRIAIALKGPVSAIAAQGSTLNAPLAKLP